MLDVWEIKGKLTALSSPPVGASEAGGGPGHGKPHRCLWLHGVLSKDKGRREGGVRDGHQGGATGPTWQKTIKMPSFVKKLNKMKVSVLPEKGESRRAQAPPRPQTHSLQPST